MRPRSAASCAGQLEQPLDRGVQVVAALGDREAERHVAGLGLDRDRRAHAQVGEDPQALLGAQQRRGDVVVDRARELLGELGRRRRRHQVDAGHEHLLAHQLVRCAPHERGLAVAARREDDDVLAVADVGLELGDLLLAVGERVVERERAEAEGIDVVRHADQRNADLREKFVTRTCVTQARVTAAGLSPSWRAPRPPRTRRRRSSGRRGRARASSASAAGTCRT